ncbi:MAG: Hsp20/alpha crystallin family protein [Chloroflexi bacterium]|nr:MAG: Hsp20/alpha crystallin family protein [Chloroflexota bacterium]TME48278.1 MAG: Hsp20/alpha crystallin family protein [Chloroflexota bacterium]
MSSVIRWSPISDLMSLHSAMDRLFSDSFGVPGQSRTVGAAGEGYLPLDIYQTDKEWVIRAAVPGADPSTVDVTVDGGQISIKGEIKPAADARPETYWLRENFYGNFSRQVTLPEDALGDQARAQFMNGVLTLTVPKAQPAKPKSVKIPISGATSTNSEPKQLETAAKK